ncbi:hypothetical protein HK097_006161, partial [Rhizophlyctis rosea]
VLSRLQGTVHGVGVEKSVLNKFFAFQVYQVVYIVGLGTIVASYASGELKLSEIGDDLDGMVMNMTKGFISSSTLYITFLATGFTSYGLEIVQAAGLLLTFIRRHVFRLTPRQKYENNKPPALNFAVYYGAGMIAFLVAVCYGVVQPLILPFACVYFFLARVVLKYQCSYVMETRVESGGSWWLNIFTLLCISLTLFQLVTFGAIFLASSALNKKNTYPGRLASFITAGAMLATLLFYIICTRYYGPRAEYVSKKEALEEDSEAEGGRKAEERGRVVKVGGREENLEDRVFNPALVKPLWKVWMEDGARGVAEGLYRIEFEDLEDYCVKNGLQ